MRKILLAVSATISCFAASAQLVATFESQPLSQPDTFYVNYSSPGTDIGFNESSIHFQCFYDTSFGGLWGSGFAYSNMTDSITSGYLNQYAAKTAKGYNGSNNYAVYWQGYGIPSKIALQGISSVKQAAGFYITNSTYAYNSMKTGDFVAKKFGGSSGNDPDWFKLTVHGFWNGQMKTDSVSFYLADFRDANNANDYIVKDWRWVNLTSLGNVDSLQFDLSSSDNGTFGMNTPAYFCMDNFTTNISTDVKNIPSTGFVKTYPNPAGDKIFAENVSEKIDGIQLMDISGKILASYNPSSAKTEINIADLQPGNYFLRINTNSKIATVRFQKN